LSNTFRDDLKQLNISLFLGEFKPEDHEIDLWQIQLQQLRLFEPSNDLKKKADGGQLNGKGISDYISKHALSKCTSIDSSNFLMETKELFR
jgi:hypothetical protein